MSISTDWAALTCSLLENTDSADELNDNSDELSLKSAANSVKTQELQEFISWDEIDRLTCLEEGLYEQCTDFADLSSNILSSCSYCDGDDDFQPEIPIQSQPKNKTKGHFGTRTEEFLRDKYASEASLLQLLMEDFQVTCNCKKLDCSEVTSVDVAKLRISLWIDCQTTSERRDNLLDLLGQLSAPIVMSRFEPDRSVKVNDINYMIGRLHVCESTFCSAAGIHPTGSMFRNAKKLIFFDQKPKVYTRDKPGDRGEIAMAWLLHYSQRAGDSSPTNGKVTILKDKRKIYTYKNYVKENLNPICLSHFYQLWNERHPTIKTLKESAGFKICSICYNVPEMLQQRNRDKTVRDYLQIVLNAHYAQQLCEREYFRVSELCALEGDLITMVIDAMDQCKTYIPIWASERTSRETDRMQSFNKVSQVLIGCRICFKTNIPTTKLLLFVSDASLDKDSNTTIECIHQATDYVFRCYESIGKKPPTFLHIQMDNASDNKSKYVMAYLTDLCRRQIFTRTCANFLMVGHTHLNVDQHFGEIAGVLNESRCITPQQLDDNVVKANAAYSPMVIRLTKIHDIKTYYTPYLKNVSGHAKPHQYRFWCNNEGASTQFRMWSTTKWYPDTNAIPCARARPEINRELRTELASIVAVIADDGDTASILDIVEDNGDIQYIANDTANIFMHSFPPIDSVPGVAAMAGISEFQSCITSLDSNADNNIMFRGEGFDSEANILRRYCMSKIGEFDNQRLRASTWTWPRITRSHLELAYASPQQSNLDIFNVIQEAARASMSDSDLKLVDTIISKHVDPGIKQVKVHVPRAAKKADGKMIAPAKAARKSKRIAAEKKVEDAVKVDDHDAIPAEKSDESDEDYAAGAAKTRRRRTRR